jgi:hypothetical protein
MCERPCRPDKARIFVTSLCAFFATICILALALLCFVLKHVPHHVLVTKMSHVMDSRIVSRGLCFTHGNPTLQPSYLAMVVVASLVHALGAFQHALLHHPLLSMLADPLILYMLSPHISV